ncbi:TIGR01906 family membrane protein [Intestinibacter sp.]|uniref:TIGR01906 family membrane protein n=1 Tax=Intestinibacter sp. TaxID=1965304 RepID=UPI002A916438|nr:TIGR01906 family membrane protein [Intestinibacter sp.]MDY5211321.1 TIGR01906 family membrane protein [Intestinibacter sp.]
MRKLLNVVISICLALFVIGSSVIITMNIKNIYYNDIDKLNIESMIDLSREDIIENYDYLIDYNLSWNAGEFELPSLPSSPNGKIHFEEVRDIFQNVKVLTIITGIISIIGGILQIRKGQFKFLRNASILIVIMPILLAIPIAINFNACFIMFHKIMFSNDYWIFNPIIDPVINMLPEAFFMHMGVAILAIMIVGSAILQLMYHKVKKLNYSNTKIKN